MAKRRKRSGKKSYSPGTQTRHRRLHIEALDARIVLDAGGLLAGGADLLDASLTDTPGARIDDIPDPSIGELPALDLSEGFSRAIATAPQTFFRQEVVFVDSGVGRDLLASLQPPEPGVHREVVTLASDRPGLNQIADWMAGRTDIDAVHVISHGKDAALQLGSTTVAGVQLRELYSGTLQTIGASLSEDADILIYGCNLSATDSGRDFVQTFSELTGADVAASDDLTGDVRLGGDWDLEVATGVVEASMALFPGYSGLLIDTDGDGIDDEFDLDDDNDGILDIQEALETEFPSNGSFESPVIAENTYRTLSDSSVPGWTSTIGVVELWSSGFIRVESHEGTQHAELNSTRTAGIFQDFSFPVGAVVKWSVAHRGRNGVDTATVSMGPADGSLAVIQTMMTDNDDWVVYSGSFIVPEGQTVTRMQFDAVATALPESSQGNFIDAFTVTAMVGVGHDGAVDDQLDLDSDDDGISDLFESGVSAAILAADTNADGFISLHEAADANGGVADADNDGLMDIFDADPTDATAEASIGTVPIDTDMDGVVDFLDLDSDNDGIPDTIEARPTSGYVTNDGNVGDNDADGDGIINIFDGNDATTGAMGGTHRNLNAPQDTDGDDTPDYLDSDSDNDGKTDAAESGLTLTNVDADSDGLDDGVGTTSYLDPDGIVNDPRTGLANQDGDTTEVAYREAADLALVKSVVGFPSRLPTGNFSVTFEVTAKNRGTVVLRNLSIVDDLESKFGAGVHVGVITAPAIIRGPTDASSVAPTLATYDGGLNGSSNTNLFDGVSGTLAVGDSLTVQFTVEVDPDASGTAMALKNSVFGSAVDKNGYSVTDNSDSGTDPDSSNPMQPGDTGGEADPTPVSISDLRTTKSVTSSPVKTADGNWSVPFSLTLENTGTVDLEMPSLTDDLRSSLSTLLVSIDSLALDASGVTGGTAPGLSSRWDGESGSNLLDGTGTLAPGDSLTVTFNTVLLSSELAASAPIVNQAIGSAVGPAGEESDPSDSGTDPNGNNDGAPGATANSHNDPTPISIGDLSVTKAVVGTPMAMANGNWSTSYRLVVQNTGATNLTNPQITENLENAFGADVFVGVLTAPFMAMGPTSTGSTAPTFGTWDGGLNGSTATSLLDGTSGILLPGDSFSIEYTVEVDPDATGDSQSMDNQVRVVASTPAGATVSDDSDSGTDPATSNTGQPGDTGGFNDPTPLQISDIGVSKQVSHVVTVSSGVLDVDYVVVVENTGSVDLTNLQVEEDLRGHLGNAFVNVQSPVSIVSSDLSSGASLPNLASTAWDGEWNTEFFDGTSGQLMPGDSMVLKFTVRVDTSLGDTTSPNDFTNQVMATGTGMIAGMPVQAHDLSDDGTNPNNTNGSGTTDDPTALVTAQIRSSKSYGTITPNADGSYTVPVTIVVENDGTQQINNLSLLEDIGSQFGNALLSVNSPMVTALKTYTGVLPQLNPAWGTGSTSADVIDPSQSGETLEAGDAFQFTFNAVVDPDAVDGQSQAMMNQASVSGDFQNYDGSTARVSDLSGADTTVNSNGIDNDSPSRLKISELRAAKTVTATSRNGSHHHVTFAIRLENTGSVALTGINLLDDLNTQLQGALVGIDTVTLDASGVGTGTPPTLNYGTTSTQTSPFDGGVGGTGADNLLNGDGVLNPGESIMISLTAVIDPPASTSNTLVNSATGKATGHSGEVTDLSDSGTDPNGVNANEPGDTGGSNDPTPIAISTLAISKAVNGTPVALANGNFSVPFILRLENTGTISISELQVVDELETWFGSDVFIGVTTAPSIITGPAASSSSQPTLAMFDGGLDGSSNTKLFDGTSGQLASGDSLTVGFTVELNPAANTIKIPLKNQAVFTATSSDGTQISDLSDSGTDPDSSNPGEPGDTGGVDDATEVEIGNIGAAKEIVRQTEVASGVYDVEYRLKIQNTGTVPLTNIQLSESLAKHFGAAYQSLQSGMAIITSQISPGGSMPAFASPAWNGSSIHDVFDGNSGLLLPGDWVQLTFVARIDTGAGDTTAPNNFGNQLNVAGLAVIDGVATRVADLSDSGSDPTTDNGSGTLDDATLFTQNLIRASKQYGTIVTNTDGSYNVPVSIIVQNAGTTVLDNLSLVEDLAAQFGNALIGIQSPTISAVGTYAGVLPLINPAWGITNTEVDALNPSQTGKKMQAGDQYEFAFVAVVDPDAGDSMSQVMENQAIVSGQGVDAKGATTTVTDKTGANGMVDAHGSNNDTPTSLIIPELRSSKQVVGSTRVGENYEVGFEIKVENTGTTNLTGIDLHEDFATQLGMRYVSLQNVTLESPQGQTASPPTLNYGATAGDTAYDGGVISANLLNSDGTLEPGATLTVRLTIVIDPDALGDSSTMTNQAQAVGHGPNGEVTDLSDSGAEPSGTNTGQPGDTGGHDDATPILLNSISISKAVVGSPEIQPNSNALVTYRLVMKNTGTSSLVNLQIHENLESQFGVGVFQSIKADPKITVAPANASSTAPTLANYTGGLDGSTAVMLFDGTTGKLVPGDSLTVEFQIEVDPDANGAQLLHNSATATGQPVDAAGTPVVDASGAVVIASDVSDSGTDPNSTNPGAPGDNGTANDPTPLAVESIAAAKQQVGDAMSVADQPLHLDVTFQVVIQNTGNATLTGLDLYDDVSSAFGNAYVSVPVAPTVTASTIPIASNVPTINSAWATDTSQSIFQDDGQLAPGETVTIALTVRVNSRLLSGSVLNQAQVIADDLATGEEHGASDLSDSGTNPASSNPSASGDTGGFNDATPVVVADATIGIAKEMMAAVTNDGMTFRFHLEHLGNAKAVQISVPDDLDAVFGKGNYSVTHIEKLNGPSTISVNASFNGSGDKEVIAANSSMLPGEKASFEVTINVNKIVDVQSNGLGFYENQVLMSSMNEQGRVFGDYSNNGTDPDEDGDGTPINDRVVSSATLTPNATVGVAKNAAVDQSDLSVTFDIFLENFGNTVATNLQLQDNLDAVFGSGVYTVTSTTSVLVPSTLIVNGHFDGSHNDELLITGGSLMPGEKAHIRIQIATDGAFGEFENSVTVKNEDLAGTAYHDASVLGNDPDPDEDGNPNNNTQPTPFLLAAGKIAGRVILDSSQGSDPDVIRALPNIVVRLNGTDVKGKHVSLSAVTDADGGFRFERLLPGEYTITQEQPEGLFDGADIYGNYGDDLSVNDRFVLDLTDVPANFCAEGYVFTERGLNPLIFGKDKFLISSLGVDLSVVTANHPPANPPMAEVQSNAIHTFALNDRELVFEGTHGDDDVAIHMGTGKHVVVINSTQYTWDVDEIDRIVYRGRGGLDQTEVFGAPGPDRVTLQPGMASYVHADYDLRVYSSERITARDQYGEDTLFQVDSYANDSFLATSNYTLMRALNNYYRNESFGFKMVVGNATMGGFDQAVYYDTVGDDTVRVLPEFTRFESETNELRLVKFESTQARAVLGGQDQVTFVDSVENDRFALRPDSLAYEGNGYSHQANGFESQRVEAWRGGEDHALIETSQTNSVVVERPGFSEIRDNGRVHRVIGVGSVDVHSGGGNDIAILFDSAGDDLLVSDGNTSTLSGEGYRSAAHGFQRVLALASNGTDRAEVLNAISSEQLVASDSTAQIAGPGRDVKVRGFDRLTAVAEDEEHPTANIDALDFVYSLQGNWSE